MSNQGKGLQELAKLHLELGEGNQITGQTLFNRLRDQGYSIDHRESETQNYFTNQETGLKQTYEVEKDGNSYELHIEKEKGLMNSYWFEES